MGEVASGQTSSEMESTPDRTEKNLESFIIEVKGTEKCP